MYGLKNAGYRGDFELNRAALLTVHTIWLLSVEVALPEGRDYLPCSPLLIQTNHVYLGPLQNKAFSMPTLGLEPIGDEVMEGFLDQRKEVVRLAD